MDNYSLIKFNIISSIFECSDYNLLPIYFLEISLRNTIISEIINIISIGSLISEIYLNIFFFSFYHFQVIYNIYETAVYFKLAHIIDINILRILFCIYETTK